MSEKLWTDERIVQARQVTGSGVRVWVLSQVHKMRDEYESELARLRGELATAHARIWELEAGQWEPDWNAAPDWAMWWAMDADGYSYWYSKEPQIKQFGGMWSQGSGYGEPAGRYIIPEWRETKRRRPQAAQDEVQP